MELLLVNEVVDFLQTGRLGIKVYNLVRLCHDDNYDPIKDPVVVVCYE